MRRSLRLSLVSVAVPVLAALPATAAFAAPTNAPGMTSGTADCGPDGTFTFVVNSGRSDSAIWNPAFVTRTDGRTAIFIPASLDLTFTFPGGGGTSTEVKQTGAGPVSCEISAVPFPGASITGTVTGRLVWTG
jgi:hypothetical protein